MELQNTVTTQFVYFQYGSNGLLIKLLQKMHNSIAQISKQFCTILTPSMINRCVATAIERPQLRKNEWHWERPGHIPCLTSGAFGRHRGDAGRDRGIAFLKHTLKDHIRRITMDKILSAFQCLWSRPSGIGEAEIKKWAQTEYKKDWLHAYNYYMAKGHMPNVRETNNVR